MRRVRRRRGRRGSFPRYDLGSWSWSGVPEVDPRSEPRYKCWLVYDGDVELGSLWSIPRGKVQGSVLYLGLEDGDDETRKWDEYKKGLEWGNYMSF